MKPRVPGAPQDPAGAITLLLVGAEAAALAPRLAVSGYRPVTEGEAVPGEALAVGARTAEETGAADPAAVILSPGQGPRIPDLRRSLGARPMLLGITGDSVEGRSQCLDWGADDVWLPALGTSHLLTRLRLHLGLAHRGAPLPASLLQVGDLRLDTETRQAWRGARTLTLTAREYQLLRLLMEAQGTVLSRARILAEIWPDQRGGASNVIEVYVRYLRRKLEEGGEPRLLHTVRGQGYGLGEGRPDVSPRPPTSPQPSPEP